MKTLTQLLAQFAQTGTISDADKAIVQAKFAELTDDQKLSFQETVDLVLAFDESASTEDDADGEDEKTDEGTDGEDEKTDDGASTDGEAVKMNEDGSYTMTPKAFSDMQKTINNLS